MSFRPGQMVQSPVARILIEAAVLALLLGLPFFGIERIQHLYQNTEAIEDVGRITGDLGLAASSMGTHLYAYAKDGEPGHLTDYEIAARDARRLRDDLTRASAAAARAGTQTEVARVVSLTGELVTQGDRFRDALQLPGATGRGESEDGWLVTQEAFTKAVTQLRPLAEAALEDSRGSVVSGFNRTELLILLLAAVAATAFAVYATYQVRTMLRDEAIAGVRLGEAEGRADFNSSVVSLASHELRNPLAVAKLAGEMIEQAATDHGDTDLQELAAMVSAAIRRAETLVAELLDMGRLDAGRLDLASGPVELRLVLDEVVAATVEFRGARPIEITGPSATPFADPDRLAIVLRNLVDNAFKYSPPDSPVRIDIGSDGEVVVVRVLDSGPGIPVADRARVFARFERLRQTQHVGGTGIGLHLSRELALRMGGSLTVQDADVGACFELTLSAAGSSHDAR